jgi:DNA-binding beta-propeller fold protein YncE
MDGVRASQAQRARTATNAVRVSLRLLISLAATALILILAVAASASASSVVCSLGSGAGNCNEPQGVAVDLETGRLYVADNNNHRVDVFDSTGAFEKAFGWGVKNGESKLEVCTTNCQKGLEGPGAGQFSVPTSIAVDNSPTSSSRHDIYVVDRDNQRVEKFDAEGKFLLTFGGGVDKTAPGNICTAESSHACGAGSDGFGEGEFTANEGFGKTGIFVAVGPSGTVYVVDSRKPGGERDRLQRFDSSGAEIAPQHILRPEGVGVDATGLAVDSTGNLYVAAGEGIREYEPSGAFGPINEIEGASSALAVDAEGNLFSVAIGRTAGEGVRQNIVEHGSSGVLLRRFGYGSFFRIVIGGLAPFHSTTGDIYASDHESNGGTEGSKVLHIGFPPPGPVILPGPCEVKPGTLGNTTATLQAEVNPEGKATTVGFEYITAADFTANGDSFSGAHPATSTQPTALSIPLEDEEELFEMHPASAKASLVPETEYHCRVLATNADAPTGTKGEEGTFTSLPPLQIGATWAADVGTEAATLNATVNPLGIPTTGYFEYVDDATYQKDIAELGPEHGFDHATDVPDVKGGKEPIDFGSGEAFKAGSVALASLSPGTSYRYRIVATDSFFHAGFDGPTEAVRTSRPSVGGLPDSRAYELVSPGEKNSAEVAEPGTAGGLTSFGGYSRIQAGAGTGEAITYTSWTAFGTPKGAPGTSQYISKRTPSGWSTEDISPFGTGLVIPPYRGFSADLGFGAFVIGEPPLTPEAVSGFANLYLRDNQTGALQALTTEAPKLNQAAVEQLCLDYAGASEDGSRAFFDADGSYAGVPEPNGGTKEFSLYEWSAAKGLTPVSVLPGEGVAAAPAPGTSFGALGEHCQTGETIARNVVSADGKIVFWTYGGKYKNSEHPLLARVDGAETIELDAKVPGESNGGKGTFLAASTDGTRAFFTAPGRLTTTAKAAGQLYLYDFGKPAGERLADLTPGTIAPAVQGILGASDNGAYIYFVAKGALTGEGNAAGEKALAGEANLYSWHEGEGLRFVAILASGDPEDATDWSSVPRSLDARVSSDGRYLAFLSIETEKLAGYDNTVAAGIHCQLKLEHEALGGGPFCPEAFLYDAEAKTLVCASCNPTGARPLGPTVLPGWSNPYEGRRYLSEDGSRLDFESFDELSPRDTNQKRDVYEFERAGAGTCNAESADFDPASDGCHFLISSGKSTDESYLLDASSSGRDVFFSTRQSLVGWDVNENYDVYDAREGGGFPEPSEQSICQGEACKPSVSVPPGTSSPATPSFRGPGNPALPGSAPVKPKSKPLTRAQELAKALKACRTKHNRSKRAACESRVRKRYGHSKPESRKGGK